MELDRVFFTVDDSGVTTYSTIERYIAEFPKDCENATAFGSFTPAKIEIHVRSISNLRNMVDGDKVSRIMEAYGLLLDVHPRINFIISAYDAA